MQDGNDLAMVLAFGPPDALTYGNPLWQDAAGNLYAAASFDALDEWMVGAQSPLARPVWDDTNEVSMAGADRAQALLYVVPRDADGNLINPLANPNRITIMPNEDGLAALSAMGLTQVPSDI
jgi:hypothetical protein